MNTELRTIDLNNFPILFQDKGSESTSSKYKHITTMSPAQVIMESGWMPREFVAVKARTEEGKAFGKHRIRFFNPNLPKINDSHLELLLTNSHNAKSSFELQLGIYRLVCSNGLVVGDTFEGQRVRHVGYTDEKVFQAINSLLPNIEKVSHDVKTFSDINLSQTEQEILAGSILDMRFDGEKYQVDPIAIRSVLRSNRGADNKSDLWTTFNRVQENVIRRGFYANKKEEDCVRLRTVRPVKSFQASDKLNRAMWSLAEKMAEIKLQG